MARAPVRRAFRTSISGALMFSAPLFENNGYRGIRRVIDVSGDGTNNQGPLVTQVRDDVIAKGIVINGLPIMLKEPQPNSIDIKDLDIYYEDCVIGGPGAFVVPIREREKFKEAIRTKLVLDIAALRRSSARHPGGGERAAHLLHHRRADVAAPLGRRRDRLAVIRHSGTPDLAAIRMQLVAREPRHDLHMRRIAELIDRRDRRQPVAAVGEQMRASRAKVAALHDTAITSGTFDAASSRACASAPWRGGSNTTASNDFSSSGASGRRNRSRVSAATGLRPGVLAACTQGRDRIRVAVGRDDARAFGEPQRERPDAAEQIGDRFAPCRHAPPRGARAPLRLPRSPAGTRPAAARRAPCPCVTVGAARCAISSPWRVSRASRCVSARRASAAACCGDSGPEPRTSTSSPPSVAVTWMSSGLFSAPSASAIAHAAGIAPSSDGASTGQRSIGDDVMRALGRKADFEHVARRCAAHGTPRAAGPRRGRRSGRRPAHRAPPARSASTTRPRFQSR